MNTHAQIDEVKNGAVHFSKELKKRMEIHLKRFLEHQKGPQFKIDYKQREDRVTYFQTELPEKVDELTEIELSEVVGKLWASQVWGNKQYYVQKLISDNGIEKIRSQLKLLIDPSSPAIKRYSDFQIKGFGPASVTEILCYVQPEECGIWNHKARQALKFMGLDLYIDTKKYRLSPEEYRKFNEVLDCISQELKSLGLKDTDLLFVDYFLYEVSETNSEQKISNSALKKGNKAESKDFDHDEIRDLIQNIGVMLGFDAETETRVGHGAKVDAVWTARIANLGLVKYVFEVHKNGSIDSLLLNLQKAKSNQSVQKVIAVSDELQLEKIRRESEGLPEEFQIGRAHV